MTSHYTLLVTFTLILLIFQSCGGRYVEEDIIKSIGDSYQGGTIAYLFGSDDSGYDASKQHGLIVALEDQGGMDVLWWNKNLGDVERRLWDLLFAIVMPILFSY